MLHEIKISEPYYHAVREGRKTFEIRRNDRGYNAGDKVLMTCVGEIGTEKWDCPKLMADIGFVTAFKQQDNYVVFSLLNVKDTAHAKKNNQEMSKEQHSHEGERKYYLTKSITRKFMLVRDSDESGVSGLGGVAEGVEFSNGTCAMSWLTEAHSVGVYPNIKELERIHGHGGKTRVVFHD